MAESGDRDRIGLGGLFGPLRIERELGTGAFAKVWLARDTLLGREVALKVLRTEGLGPSSPADRERFLREARIVAGFSHANIVVLYRLHETPDHGLALEMEYLDGGTLEERIGEGKAHPPEEALPLLRDIASGLSAAHSSGVLHGDLKPANVLLGREGRVKLADFGLARLLGVHDLVGSRRDLAGTPRYLAPEVIGGEAYRAQSDVWSAGVLLYRLLTGRFPYPQTTLYSLFLALQNDPPAPLGDAVPAPIARVIERCLRTRPEERYTDGKELLAALEELLQVPLPAGAARQPAEVARAAPPARGVLGREREAAILRAAFGRLEQGRGGVLLVTGPAGIGKSMLVATAAEEAGRRGWGAAISAVSPVAGLVRPLLAAVLPAGGGEAGAGARPSAPSESVPALEAALVARAERGPLLVAIEDFHAASPEEAQSVARSIRRVAPERILWVVSERTSDLGLTGSQHLRAEPLLDLEGVTRIDLGPLPREAIARVVEAEAEGLRVSGAVLDRVVHRSEGNPLFAIQIFRHLRETDAVGRSGAEWVPDESIARSVTPPALRELVTRRLARLPESARSLLDVAGVDGLEFDGEAVAAVLRRPLLPVLRQLQSLHRSHGLVAPQPRGYRFAHPLLQEVIYAEVAADLRRAVHRALADHLEQRGTAVDPERLGSHWERADAPARAAPYLLRAAAAAADRLENHRCVELAARAGVLAGPLDKALAGEHSDALLRVAGSLGELGRQVEREALYEGLLRVAEETADPVLRMRVHARRGATRLLGGGLRPGDEEQLRAAAERLPDSVDKGIAHHALGLAERFRGRLDRAEEEFAEAGRIYVRHGALGRHGSILDQLGILAERAGEPRRAAALFREAAATCRRAGRTANAAISEVNAISVEIDLGAVEGQAERLEEAARLLEIDGLPGPAARVRLLLSEVQFALGDLPGARRTAGEALETLRRVDLLPGIVEGHTAVCWLAAAAGETGPAFEHHALAREAANRQDNAREKTKLLALESILLVRTGERRAAADLARRAIGAAAAEPDAEERVETAALLAEAFLLGLESGLLRETLRLLPPADAPPGEGAVARSTRALLEGLLARESSEASPSADEARLAALRRPDAGPRRALLRLAADLLEADLHARRGDAAAAARARGEAARGAERLGYRGLT